MKRSLEQLAHATPRFMRDVAIATCGLAPRGDDARID